VANLLRASALATAGLCVLSLVAADGLHNVLLTQLQLWRAHWISHLLVLAFLPILLLRTWRKDDAIAQIVVLAVAAAAVSVNVRYASTTMFTLWSGFALWLHLKRPPIAPRVLHAARWATIAALAGVSLLILVETGRQLAKARGMDLGSTFVLLIFMTMPMLSLPAILALLHAWRRGGWMAGGAFALAAAGAVLGIVQWDQRPPWIRFVETRLQQEHPWEKLIAPHEQVLWWEESYTVWGLLHRSSYYSVAQGAGLLFNRQTAIEHQRRAAVTGAIQLQRDVCDLMAGLQPDTVDGECWPTFEAVEYACQGDDLLRFVILNRKLPRGLIAEWTPGPGSPPFYLHDCKQIR
jgi:hypothetical protein